MKEAVKKIISDKKTNYVAIIVISLIFILGGIAYYKYQKMNVERDKANDLRAIAELKVDQITRWMKEREGDAKTISTSKIFINTFKKFLKNKSEVEKEDILERISLIWEMYNYESIFITKINGDIILSVGTDTEIFSSSTLNMLGKYRDTHEIVFTDFYYCEDDDKVHYDIIAPIIDEGGNKIGYILFRVEPNDFIFPLIQSWPVPSKTAETLLIKKDGDYVLFLNELRFKKNTALKLRIPLQDDLPAAQAIMGKTGVFLGKDYLGNEVVSYLSKVKGTNWFMVAKVNKDEIYSELYYREGIIFAVLFLSILTIILGLMWFYHYRQRNIYRTLWKVQEEYKTILKSIGDAVITTDTEGKIQYINKFAEKLTGWDENEAKDKKLEEVFKICNEATRAKIDNPVSKVLKEGLIVNIANHTILISKSGEEIPIADSGAPIKDENGEIIGVVLVFRDQTEEHRSQEIINARLRLFEYADANSLEEFLTLTLDEVEKLTKSKIGFYHFVEEDQETLSLQAWSTRTKNEYCNAEGKGRHYNVKDAGVWVDCMYKRVPVVHNDYESLNNKKGLPEGHAELKRELVVPILRDDKIVAILGVGNKSTEYTEKDVEIVSYLADIAWEITYKKIINDRIEYLAKRYDMIFENQHAGMIVVDEKDRIEFINQSFANYFRLNIENKKLIGLRSDEFLPNILPNYREPKKVEELIKDFVKKGEIVTDQEVELKDGRIMQVDFIPIKIDGENTGRMWIHRDITTNKLYENEIIHQNAILDAIINNSHSILIFMVDKNYCYIKYNGNYFREMKKRHSNQIGIGMNMFDNIDNMEEKNAMEKIISKVFEGESLIEVKHDKRNDVYYEYHWNQVRKTDGDIYAVSCFMIDVTERIRSSERILQLNSMLAAIRNVNQLIVKEKDRQRLIQQACDLLIEARGFKRAIIVLVDDNKNIQSYSHSGVVGKEIDVINQNFDTGELFACQRKALEDRKLTVVENAKKDCIDCPFETYGDSIGVILVPVLYEDKLYGVLYVTMDSIYLNDTEEHSLFNEVAGDIGYALHKMDLEEEKAKAIQLLNESEELYKDLFEQSPMGYQSLDKDGYFKTVNKVWLDTLGYNKEEVIGKWFGDFLAPEYKNAFNERFALFKEKGRIHSEFEMLRKDGARVYISFEGRIGYGITGEFKQTHCTLQDITEKRKAEEALKESERKYSDLYENSPDMHLSVNPKTACIVQCNNTLCNVTGYTKEELYGKPLKELYHSRSLETFQRILDIFKKTGKVENEELEVLKKNGDSIIVLLNSTAVYDKNGEILHSRSIWRDITLQKKMEVQEKRLWKILKESLNEIYIFKKDTLKFEFVNDGALKNLGYTLEEMQNLTPVDIKPEYNLIKFNEAINPLVNHKKEVLIFETVHKRKNGTLYNVEIHLQLMSYGFDEIFVAIIQDTTERKKAEREIKESEKFIRTVMDNLPVGIAVNSADPEVKFQYINDNFTKFYDVSKAELSEPDNFWNAAYEDPFFREEMRKRVLNDCASGDPDKMIWENIPIIRNGRTVRYISARNIPLTENHLMISTVWDVTERKIAETALEESEKKYRSIVQYLPESVIVHSEGKILYANPQALKLAGVESFKEIESIPVINFVHPEYRDIEIKRIEKIIKNKNNVEMIEEKFINVKGDVIDVEVIGVPTIYEGKEAIQTIIREITERKKYQTELINAKEKAEKSDRLKTEFLAQMSHEIRTPLHIVTSSLNIIKEDISGKIEEDDIELFDSIEISTKRIIRTIDLLLNVSELTLGIYTPSIVLINLDTEVLLKIITEQKQIIKAKGLGLVYRYTARHKNIEADIYSVTQMMANLLDNAVKYTNQGRIEINVTDSSENKICVEIMDTGIGISKEFMDTMYEPFKQEDHGYSRRYEGVGLGLALVKKYCEINNAEIEVESTKGKGSIFRVYFNRI